MFHGGWKVAPKAIVELPFPSGAVSAAGMTIVNTFTKLHHYPAAGRFGFQIGQRSKMEISVRRLSEVQIIQVRGTVRLGIGVDSFRQAMEDALAAGDTRMVINFAEVPMIDSSGIGILVRPCVGQATGRRREAGHTLQVRSANPEADRRAESFRDLRGRERSSAVVRPTLSRRRASFVEDQRGSDGTFRGNA